VRLGSDPDAGVVGGVLDEIQALREPIGDQGRAPGWDRFVRSALVPAIERIGRAPKPGEAPEIAALRARLLERLGRDGKDPETRAWASREIEAILAGRSTLDDALADVAVDLAATQAKPGEHELYDRLLSRALDPSASPVEHDRFLEALVRFEDRALAERTLALYPEGKVRGDEIFFVYGLADIDATMPDRLLAWTIENYPTIARRLPSEFLPFLARVGAGCEPARVERAAAFFGAPERKVTGTDRALADTRDRLNACLELRRREGAAAARYLAGGAAPTVAK
jgi:alanyl aminopeptidase